MLDEQSNNLLESRQNAARLLGISLRKLELLIAERTLKTVRIGRRVLVPRRVLEDFVRHAAN